MEILVFLANENHKQFAESICNMMEEAANVRGTGIAKRSPEYIQKKMEEGKAVIALDNDMVIGFCYIESWEEHRFVANSGLIVHPDYRNTGLAKAIKKATFDLSKKKFPNARLFGITTSMAVMQINSNLGYKPVTFSELTKDEAFWLGCRSCANYDILQRTNKTMCLCTGMVCDLSKVPVKNSEEKKEEAWENFKRFMKLRKERIQRMVPQFPKLKKALKDEPEQSSAGI